MGNNQSEPSDDENQKYLFHEKTLKEAENDLNVIFPPCQSNEDEYFSADEGDSVRSITPPRTRPESSSEEEVSDSGDNGEESCLAEQPNSDLDIKIAAKSNLRSKKSCGQCNVSTFQEHDSIGPEIAATRRAGRNSAYSAQNQSANASLPVGIALSSEISPFKPITSDSSIIEDRSTSKVGSRHKINCSKRKRLGYFESDSEENEEQENSGSPVDEKKKASNKKVKQSTSSFPVVVTTKKALYLQRNQDTDSENSDSDKADSINKRIPPLRKRPQGRGSSTKETQAYLGQNVLAVANIEGSPMDHGAQSSENVNEDVISSKLIQRESEKKCAASTKSDNRHNRNPLDKVVPNSQRVSSDLIIEGCKATPYSSTPPMVSQLTNSVATNTVVNSGNSAFVSTRPEGIRRPFPTPRQQPENSANTSTTSHHSVDKVEDSKSPFKDVVLTPTKLANRNDYRWSAMRDSTAGINCQQQCLSCESDLMEVDDQSNSNVYCPDYRNKKHNSNLTAENFKRIWSEKKKNISSNFKSFIKSLSPSTSLNSKDDNQKSFVSTPPKPVIATNEAFVLKQPQNTITTYVSSERKQRSFVSSSPHESRSRQHSPAKTDISPAQKNSPISALSWPKMSPISSSQTLQKTSNQKNDETFQSHSFISESSASSERVTRVSGLSTPGSSYQNTSFDFLDKLAINILPNSASNEVLSFKLAGLFAVRISVSDLSEQSTVGIVNWTDGGLTHTVTPCSQKIAAKAGALMRAACSDYIENKGSDLEAPDVLTTPAGGQFDRSVEALLHVVAPHWIEGNETINKQALLEVYANCLRFADERLGLDSLSFPIIGEDYYPVDVCIEAFFDSLIVYLGEHTSSPPRLTLIQLITPNPDVAQFAADFIVPRMNERSSGDSSNVASATKCPSASTPTERSSEENNRDRAPSGRLRVKRPRL
ncbi:uncharacterized protein LOC106057471 [Biomphalaria glabrata]|uniref:Uncharacterized protein LOC106057471 n=1 Tax=Biomphalaria glabrata TaxID=6526 RepID=A0A9W2YLX5_BIOGL|nr:uncharacterized protein LOC106057471 [Biomphalaria glabrata]XP_055863816.1 uncharacterized protein LOC106057471 [Biomphalaria glabrata]XP_055863817.1 uncharacterized protein LOC106057471 [Biomphalaria glabrata]